MPISLFEAQSKKNEKIAPSNSTKASARIEPAGDEHIRIGQFVIRKIGRRAKKRGKRHKMRLFPTTKNGSFYDPIFFCAFDASWHTFHRFPPAQVSLSCTFPSLMPWIGQTAITFLEHCLLKWFWNASIAPCAFAFVVFPKERVFRVECPAGWNVPLREGSDLRHRHRCAHYSLSIKFYARVTPRVCVRDEVLLSHN